MIMRYWGVQSFKKDVWLYGGEVEGYHTLGFVLDSYRFVRRAHGIEHR